MRERAGARVRDSSATASDSSSMPADADAAFCVRWAVPLNPRARAFAHRQTRIGPAARRPLAMAAPNAE